MTKASLMLNSLQSHPKSIGPALFRPTPMLFLKFTFIIYADQGFTHVEFTSVSPQKHRTCSISASSYAFSVQIIIKSNHKNSKKHRTTSISTHSYAFPWQIIIKSSHQTQKKHRTTSVSASSYAFSWQIIIKSNQQISKKHRTTSISAHSYAFYQNFTFKSSHQTQKKHRTCSHSSFSYAFPLIYIQNPRWPKLHSCKIHFNLKCLHIKFKIHADQSFTHTKSTSVSPRKPRVKSTSVSPQKTLIQIHFISFFPTISKFSRTNSLCPNRCRRRSRLHYSKS